MNNRIDDTPIYNMKVVLQETGLKPDTIRVWERRYGLPRPDRSEGGHRLYSQRDIESIKWLIARQVDGLSISRAVELWNTLIAEGNDPLQPPPPAEATITAEKGDLTEMRNAWVSACLVYDEGRAERVLNESFAAYTPESVCLGVLMKGLSQIGDGWYQGEITVQQEHFASALAMRRLEVLLDAAPPPSRGHRLLVAAPPSEEHVFSLLLLTVLLRRQGWDVVYLGSNIPLENLDDAITTTYPRLVVSSAQRLSTAADLLGMAQRLHDAGTTLAFGGRIFNVLPDLRDYIPGYFISETIEDAPQTIEQIVEGAVLPSKKSAHSVPHQQALKHFREQLPLIEAAIWQAVQDSDLQHDHVSIANMNMARGISAALEFGNMAFLKEDVKWNNALLENHAIPGQTLYTYLAIYRDALAANLGVSGEPIVRWLDDLINSDVFERER
ncbi:MAG: B12-binding domain-containing protein [Anaerolineae bacterium]|nr:B12-binding domain-containing protein [Anaerolineae bacterium]